MGVLARPGSAVAPGAVGAVATTPPSAARRIAARAAAPAARSRAASIPDAVAVRGAAAPLARHIRRTHSRASASSRRPMDTRRRAMSSGHSSRARTSSHGHSSVNDEVAVRSCVQGCSAVRISRPPVAARRVARSGSFAPRIRYSAAIGATRPTVRPSGVAPGPDLADPDRVGARFDLAEVRLVDPRRDLVQVRLDRFERRPHEDGRSRVEVARRAVRFDRLDVEARLAVDRLERRLDAAGLLAGEGPADELAEELRETRPADPVRGPPAGRVGRPGDRPPEAVLPLGQERVVAGR